MSRISTRNYEPSDFFSRQTLALTFRLLRNQYPLLAQAIKNTSDSTPSVAYDELHSAFTGEMLLNTAVFNSLKAHIIGKIISALTQIGEQALQGNHLPFNHVNLLRSLIEDWVALAEWVLNHAAPEVTDGTAYH